MKKLAISAAFAFSLFAQAAFADIVNLPEEDPSATVFVPKSWKPDPTETGFVCESPDQAVTVIFDVASEKGSEKLIEQGIEWLVENKVEIDLKTQNEKSITIGEIQWERISWKGKSEDWGPSIVGFLFADVGNGKLVTITYWIVEKDLEKHTDALDAIIASVKPVKG